MAFYAHSSESKEWQLLKSHLEEVADAGRKFADSFGAGQMGYLSGILHDAGKYSARFQQRLRGSNIRVDHSTAGAQWISKREVYTEHLGRNRLNEYLARLIAYAISGHHGGLPNFGSIDAEGTLMCRLSKKEEDVPDWSVAWTEIAFDRPTAMNLQMFDPGNRATSALLAWKYSFLGRMLYSCLVDADSINTREYCNEEDTLILGNRSVPAMEQLLNRHNDYMSKKLAGARDTEINCRRRQILEACLRQAERSPGMYSLSVPTGGGKTLSSLSFALKHAVKFGLRRIIYVIPFTSIIEQNARQFRDSLGEESVLEHHSNFNYEEYGEHHSSEEGRRLKLLSENWDAPIVVTTSVQFFESLFSNKRSKCRKLHNIANSVIIIDEAQSIPRGYLLPCLHALQELVHSYGCSVILCTATQPSWDKLGFPAQEMMDRPAPDELMDAFDRVEVEVYGGNQEVVSDQTVIEWMEEAEQVLCILNTRKHAKLLLDQLKQRSVTGVFHLSGRMCAKHRSDMLSEIRSRLLAGLPCRVVSTQLIEAGVDVDFPKVIRAFAGLDSVAQAAGRCNREGRMPEKGIMRLFYPEKHGMPSKGWMKETAIEARHVLNGLNDSESPLSITAVQQYFDRIHGICDGQVEKVADSNSIMPLLKQKNMNLEIPFEDIADKVCFIDGNTQAVIVPYSAIVGHASKVWELIHQLSSAKYPASITRQLQPYAVQIYHHELRELQKLNLLRSEGGVLVLIDTNYYSNEHGLSMPGDAIEHEILIF